MNLTNKNILYIGGMEFPDGNAAALRVRANGELLTDLGYKMFYLGVRKYSDDNLSNDVSSNESSNYFQLKYPKNIRDWIKYITDISQVVEIIRLKDIRIIIAYNFPSIGLSKLYKYCKRNNLILITDTTEWYANSLNFIKNLDTWYRMKILNKKIINNIFVSEYLSNYYYSKTPNKKRNHLVLPTLVPGSPKDYNLHCHIRDENIKVFSYVGSPGNNKNKDRLDIIIKSFATLKRKGLNGFILKIVGQSESDFLHYNPKLVESVSYLKDNIEFFGRINRISALEILKNSDFTVFFRERNRVTEAGFPTKLSESFFFGIPVITNNTSDVKKYLNHQRGFIIENFDELEVCQKLEEAIKISKSETYDMRESILNQNPLHITRFSNKINKFMHRVEKT